MRLSLLPVLLLAGANPLFAQEEIATASVPVSKKSIQSSARLKLTDGSITKGWLYQVNDSQVVLLNVRKGQLKKLNDPAKNWENKTTSFSIDQVNSISTKRKNAGLKGVLLGFGIGAVTGAIIGFADGDDEIIPPSSDPFANLFVGIHNMFAMTAEEKAFSAGLGLGVSGGIIGGIIGGVARKKFVIGGRKEKFQDKQAELMRRLVVK